MWMRPPREAVSYDYWWVLPVWRNRTSNRQLSPKGLLPMWRYGASDCKLSQENVSTQRKRGEGSSQTQKTEGRMYNMTREDANNASDVVRGGDDSSLY